MTTEVVDINEVIINFSDQSTLDVYDMHIRLSQLEWAIEDKWRVEEFGIYMLSIKNLCDEFPFWQRRKKEGRKAISERDVHIAFLLLTFLQIDFRKTQGFMKIFQDFFEFEMIPHHSTLRGKNRSKRSEEIGMRLHTFIQEKFPERYVKAGTDSTGFSSQKRPWSQVDHDLRVTQNWVKTHMTTDVDNFLILSYSLTKSNVHESQEFEGLWNNLPDNVFPIRSLADSTFSGDDCLNVAREKGATPFHDIKSNAVHVSKPVTAYETLVNFFIHWRNIFQEYYKDRNMCETVNSMIHAKFGYRLKCRSDIGRRNEVHAKMNGHNIIMLTALHFVANN